jgi:hypothetical protein
LGLVLLHLPLVWQREELGLGALLLAGVISGESR